MTKMRYGLNRESFPFETAEELAKYARCLVPPRKPVQVYRAPFRQVTPHDFEVASYLLEQMSEDWSILNKNLGTLESPFSVEVESLEELIRSWISQNVDLTLGWILDGPVEVKEVDFQDLISGRAFGSCPCCGRADF